MSTRPSLLEDQFVDMAFITSLTGLTDKWYYRLIKDGLFPKPVKLGRSSRWLKAKLKTGFRNVLTSPVNNHPLNTNRCRKLIIRYRRRLSAAC